MYSRPSGSMRKNGPRPKRSFPGTGRRSRTCIGSHARLSSRFMAIKTGHAALAWLLEACARHRTRVLVAAAVVAAAGGLLIARLSFDANVLRLLPRQAPTVRSFETFLKDFGTLDSLFIVFESSDA